jgi:hypothetical protein
VVGHKMKRIADRRSTERELMVGDLIYLKLQLYKKKNQCGFKKDIQIEYQVLWAL